MSYAIKESFLFNGKNTKAKPYTHVLFFESCLESILQSCLHAYTASIYSEN